MAIEVIPAWGQRPGTIMMNGFPSKNTLSVSAMMAKVLEGIKKQERHVNDGICSEPLRLA
jgi:hypothetical protein